MPSSYRAELIDLQIGMISTIVSAALDEDASPDDRSQLTLLWDDVEGFISSFMARIMDPGAPEGRKDGVQEAGLQALNEVGRHVQDALTGKFDPSDLARVELMEASIVALRVQMDR